MNKDQQIAYQVAFKGAIELTAHGVAEPETPDIAAEIAALADLLFEQLDKRLGVSSGSGKASTSSKRSSTSRKGGFGGRSGGSNYKYASVKQVAFIKRLLDEKDHDVEYSPSGFDWDGTEYQYDEIPSSVTQEVIESLLACDDV